MAKPLDPRDVAAIRALSDVHARALREHDAGLYLSACTEDITFIPPDEAPVSGRDAARTYLSGFPHLDEITVEVEEVERSGDLAYSRGVTWAKPRGAPQVRFKWIGIHRRQDDGSWKMARDLWSVEA